MVVQTNGRSGSYNPHVHIIMTSGGVAEGKRGEYWVGLDYFPYEVLHKKWQYYLFEMVREKEGGRQIKEVIDRLYGKYPKGLVANIQKGEVPKRVKSLAKYLAKYVVSPPISVRRILSYDGQRVRYWYHDHKSGRRKEEEVDVDTFIGRMVQHIVPKGMQRIRYYGLHATAVYEKVWKKVQAISTCGCGPMSGDIQRRAEEIQTDGDGDKRTRPVYLFTMWGGVDAMEDIASQVWSNI